MQLIFYTLLSSQDQAEKADDEESKFKRFTKKFCHLK